MAHLAETFKVQSFAARLVSLLSRSERRPVLDTRALSDHLKRDMGFLDAAPTGKHR